MRLALIAAFVSCVVLNTHHAEARPKPAKVTKTAKKPVVVKKAKAPAKPAKVEEVKAEEPAKEEPKPAPKRSTPVAQASDDEVPRTHKKR